MGVFTQDGHYLPATYVDNVLASVRSGHSEAMPGPGPAQMWYSAESRSAATHDGWDAPSHKTRTSALKHTRESVWTATAMFSVPHYRE